MDNILSGRRLNTSRNLFGYPEPGGALKIAQAELELQKKIDSFRWTFDFVSEKPLPPNELYAYEWIPVIPPSSNGTLERCNTQPSTSEISPSNDAAQMCMNCATSSDGAKQQTQITDYMRKRKFSSENEVHKEKQMSSNEDLQENTSSKLARPSSVSDDQRVV